MEEAEVYPLTTHCFRSTEEAKPTSEITSRMTGIDVFLRSRPWRVCLVCESRFTDSAGSSARIHKLCTVFWY